MDLSSLVAICFVFSVLLYTAYKVWMQVIRMKNPDKFVEIVDQRGGALGTDKDADSTRFLYGMIIIFIGTITASVINAEFRDSETCKFVLKVCEVIFIAMSGYFFRKAQESNGARK